MRAPMRSSAILSRRRPWVSRPARHRGGDAMNFDYSEEQQLLADTLKRFLATHYTFDARSKIVASTAGYSEDMWVALADMGLLGVPFDAEYGGFGGSGVDVMIVMEAFVEVIRRQP